MDYKILVTADAEADLENFMLYRIENEVVIIDNIFHELQDYENHLL